MITRIILDLDDILNSLTLHIMRHFGCLVGKYDYKEYPVHVGYDIIRAITELGAECPQSGPEFWDEVTQANLWQTAPKSPQCDFLLDRAADIVGQNQVYVATTPTKDPQSHADKLNWIWNNLPDWIHRQYFLTPRKWCLGKPNVLLIDDHLDNCRKFISEGGKALLLPRPWNPSYEENTDIVIAVEFDQLLWEREEVHAT